MKRYAYALLVTAALAAPAAFAAEEHNHDQHGAKAAAAATLTSGVVRKIDKAAGKISIAHDPIENLGMPKMTMVFRVKEPRMLEAVKEGDTVNFAADRIQGMLTVTKIETAK